MYTKIYIYMCVCFKYYILDLFLSRIFDQIISSLLTILNYHNDIYILNDRKLISFYILRMCRFTRRYTIITYHDYGREIKQ